MAAYSGKRQRCRINWSEGFHHSKIQSVVVVSWLVNVDRPSSGAQRAGLLSLREKAVFVARHSSSTGSGACDVPLAHLLRREPSRDAEDSSGIRPRPFHG